MVTATCRRCGAEILLYVSGPCEENAGDEDDDLPAERIDHDRTRCDETIEQLAQDRAEIGMNR